MKKKGADHIRMADKRTVTQKHKEALTAANEEVTKALVQLGGAAFDEAMATAKKQQATQVANEAIKKRQDATSNAALSMDIDIVNETWSYNFDEGVFTRGQAPGTQIAPQPLPIPQSPPDSQKH